MKTTRRIAHKCRSFPVAIVGGSLAGAATALQLARSGIEVVLLEKAAFPRVKACGEGLSSEGWAILCGLDRRLASLNHYPFSGYSVRRLDGSIRRISFADDGIRNGAAVRRDLLDTALLAVAEREGAVVYRGEKLQRIEPNKGGYHLKTCNRSLQVKYVVFADGGASSLPERLGFPSIKHKHVRIGTTLRVEGRVVQDPQHVHVVLSADHQICITPLGDGTLNISILSGRGGSRQWQEDHTLSMLLDQLSQTVPLEVFKVTENLPVGGLCRRRRAASYANCLTVGDSCEQLDPIGGMGMTHALLSSKLAAEALRLVLKESIDPARAFSAYTRSRELCVRPYRGFTRLAYWGLVEYPKNKIIMGLSRTSLTEQAGRAVHGNQGARSGLTWQLLNLIGTDYPCRTARQLSCVLSNVRSRCQR